MNTPAAVSSSSVAEGSRASIHVPTADPAAPPPAKTQENRHGSRCARYCQPCQMFDRRFGITNTVTASGTS